jgi:hypothetical protein
MAADTRRGLARLEAQVATRGEPLSPEEWEERGWPIDAPNGSDIYGKPVEDAENFEGWAATVVSEDTGGRPSERWFVK